MKAGKPPNATEHPPAAENPGHDTGRSSAESRPAPGPPDASRARRGRRRGPRWNALASVLIHLLLLGGIVLWQARRARIGQKVPEKPLRIALVLKEQKGAGRPRPRAARPTPHPAPPPAPPPASPPRPRVPAPPPVPATRPAPRSPAPPAPATPPSPPAPRPGPPPGPPARPPFPHRFQFNLGGTNAETNAIVHGSQVVPAKPDARFRNLEPVYPPEAAARGQQGTVVLLIHVAPDGRPSAVDIARSSGFPLLDAAARRAVARWHFLPAISHGQAVPAEMPLRVVFDLN